MPSPLVPPPCASNTSRNSPSTCAEQTGKRASKTGPRSQPCFQEHAAVRVVHQSCKAAPSRARPPTPPSCARTWSSVLVPSSTSGCCGTQQQQQQQCQQRRRQHAASRRAVLPAHTATTMAHLAGVVAPLDVIQRHLPVARHVQHLEGALDHVQPTGVELAPQAHQQLVKRQVAAARRGCAQRARSTHAPWVGRSPPLSDEEREAGTARAHTHTPAVGVKVAEELVRVALGQVHLEQRLAELVKACGSRSRGGGPIGAQAPRRTKVHAGTRPALLASATH